MNASPIRFNGNVEYRIEGDIAQLAADLYIEDRQQIENQRLSLQLWANQDQSCPDAPTGTRIAELPLNATLFNGYYQDQTLIMPPAGDHDYSMALALVGEAGDGSVQVHDYAVFANRQLFSQPRLQGRVDCQLHDTGVSLYIDAIANPREFDNRSGSLSLELWALNAPYQGGAFSGFRLAGTELGTLDGQCEWRDCNFNLDLAQPPVGEWALVLMLREWTLAGYITRDYRQLPAMVREARMQMPEQATETQPMAEFIAIDEREVETRRSAPVEAAPEERVEAKIEAKVESAEKTVEEKSADAPKSMTKDEKKPVEKSAKKKAEKAEKVEKAEEPVSVNTASAKVLGKVKGLSPRLADAIVAERPFSSLDELQKVRGIGARMIARLRDLLTL